MTKRMLLITGIFWSLLSLFLCWFLLFDTIEPMVIYESIIIGRQEVAIMISLGIGIVTMYGYHSRPQSSSSAESIIERVKRPVGFNINIYDKLKGLMEGDSRIFLKGFTVFVGYYIVMRFILVPIPSFVQAVDFIRGIRYGGSTIIGILGFFLGSAYMYIQFMKYDHDSWFDSLLEFPLAVCGGLLLTHVYNITSIPAVVMLYDITILNQISYIIHIDRWQYVFFGIALFYNLRERFNVRRFLWLILFSIIYSLMVASAFSTTNCKANIITYIYGYIPFWIFIYIPTCAFVVNRREIDIE